jgi:hypothetical protein
MKKNLDHVGREWFDECMKGGDHMEHAFIIEDGIPRKVRVIGYETTKDKDTLKFRNLTYGTMVYEAHNTRFEGYELEKGFVINPAEALEIAQDTLCEAQDAIARIEQDLPE